MGAKEEAITRLAAALNKASPSAGAAVVVKERAAGMEPPTCTDFRTTVGGGIAVQENTNARLGNRSLVQPVAMIPPTVTEPGEKLASLVKRRLSDDVV